MAAGFKWAGSYDGSEPIKVKFVIADTVVVTKGMLLNLETGEADKGASNDEAFIGVATHDIDNTADGESVEAIINPGAIYAVDDANARLAGATLDLGSDAKSVTTTSNADLIVYADSTASEPTLVCFNNTHYLKT